MNPQTRNKNPKPYSVDAEGWSFALEGNSLTALLQTESSRSRTLSKSSKDLGFRALWNDGLG